MNLYIGLLIRFLFVFALGSTLAYLPGLLNVKGLLKRNLLFLVSLLLACLFLDIPLKVSYVWALGFIFLMFNAYALFMEKRKGTLKIQYVVIDFVVCSGTLFLSDCIVAMVDDLPIKKIIIERFANGGYSFTPGHLDDMISSSLILSLIAINYQCIYLSLLKKWEARQNRKIERLQLQKRNIETQFEALQAKVNPHFLYNSLNSIAGLATVDGDKTRQMALALSRFFRYSMNREQEVMITLKEEAEMIKTYLEIEKIRFGDLLHYSIELPIEVESCQIPRMLLQPIVENCIKHGMKGDIATLAINVSFSISGNTLLLSVKDNGMPFPEDFVPGYGIQSVYDKLDLLYNHHYKVELDMEPEKDFRIYLYSFLKEQGEISFSE